ncbi:autotransporter outer membrane beta-barrel domain-containing protein [Methyloligella sp. 2.7D]|uniref:autotransporter outer membrane beta-barrel domain-containing protein n=1 Tax=unclassified Methyloligella TaxID=2625955 RepID=UPI00157DBB99|nr:autotransporter outer membrane beta-barrel domain-containing protein [Methyloligella sp. GL2]QKP77451.1 autotransporter outer membrane beta-barrel domain-containing protein [Methyloligella sp. GL2]
MRHTSFAYTVLTVLPLLIAGSAANAQCTTTDTTGCEAIPGMGTELMEQRLNRTLSSNPTQDRVTKRLNSGSWSPSTTVSTPFTISPSGTVTNVQTSLTEWQSALSAAERKRLEEIAKDNDELHLPGPVRRAPAPVDVWVSTRHQDLGTDGETETHGAATTTYVGADYRVDDRLLMGGMVQMDETRENVVQTPESMSGKAFMAGPYAAYRVTSNVIFDAKTAWGHADDRARAGEDAVASFGTDRTLSQARLSGNWNLENNWKLTPSGTVTRVTEDANSPIAGADATKLEETKVSIRPEIRRPIDGWNGNTIEPFAYLQSSVDVDTPDGSEASPQNSIGGGLAISKTDYYNIRATADYTETMNSDIDPSMTGRFSVNVPLGTRK